MEIFGRKICKTAAFSRYFHLYIANILAYIKNQAAHSMSTLPDSLENLQGNYFTS